MSRPARPRLRRVSRLIVWNGLILLTGIVLVGGGAEVWLRVSTSDDRDHPAFAEVGLPVRLEPGVGVIRQPYVEAHHPYEGVRTRANSLGFFDREPPDAERAAESCHVTLLGDSYVEALEVPVAAKAQVRLEELAARELPALDVTTSAFGNRGMAQVNQLAIYDTFARGLSPDVVVLVVVRNDLWGNSLALQAWEFGFHPDHPPWLHARPGADGEMEFVPPASDLEELRANILPLSLEPENFAGRVERTLRERSYLVDWLWTRVSGAPRPAPGGQWLYPSPAERLVWAELISRHPRHANFQRGWTASRWQPELLAVDEPPPVYREALATTAFALEQFHERAERDGAALVLLAGHDFWTVDDGSRWFALLRELVAGVGPNIPVIDMHHYIVDHGGVIADVQWGTDEHWTATGHRWAAEAILEWLREHPDVCD